MRTPIGSVKLKGRLTSLDLYEVDRKNNTVTIGIANNALTQKSIRTSENGDYFLHGCTKYYLSQFERR
jgi:hypothetical protein